MLCFVFAALVVALDQFFKHWVIRALELHGQMDFIPGIIELTHVQNDGAAFSILSNQRWLLAGISFFAAAVLIFVLFRYTEGFLGTLGLSAVLGGTVGNLIDRVFQGYVVDMFNPLFIDFAVFNIADIFLTLGFITFCVNFIISSAKSRKFDEKYGEPAVEDDESVEDDPYSMYDVPEKEVIPDFDAFDAQSATQAGDLSARYETPTPEHVELEYSDSGNSGAGFDQSPAGQPQPLIPEEIQSALDALDKLETELYSIESSDMDELLMEYGFESNADNSGNDTEIPD
ncbi:MAG: signal peptidase II [Oscillospiraceae bacterium]|nr:signal peptidase II [Oscillospiraceae bacterium]